MIFSQRLLENLHPNEKPADLVYFVFSNMLSFGFHISGEYPIASDFNFQGSRDR